MFIMFIATIFVLSTISYSLSPVFLDGEYGFYTSSSSLDEKGKLYLNLWESYGLLGDKSTEATNHQNQTELNLTYLPFSLLLLEAGSHYTSIDSDVVKGLYFRIGLPFLRWSRIKTSISAYAAFHDGAKPFFAPNLNIDVIPFKHSNFPPFIFNNSITFGKKDKGNVFQFSSLLTLTQNLFCPFIEFYTETNDINSRQNYYNSRFCSGFGIKRNNLGIRTGIEISLDEYIKKDFDYRITAAISYVFETKKQPMGHLNISVIDRETQIAIPSIIKVFGKDIEKTFQSESGKYLIQDLPLGIYTLVIESSGYTKIKVPIFIKAKVLEKTYKLKKKPYEERG